VQHSLKCYSASAETSVMKVPRQPIIETNVLADTKQALGPGEWQC